MAGFAVSSRGHRSGIGSSFFCSPHRMNLGRPGDALGRAILHTPEIFPCQMTLCDRWKSTSPSNDYLAGIVNNSQATDSYSSIKCLLMVNRIEYRLIS